VIGALVWKTFPLQPAITILLQCPPRTTRNLGYAKSINARRMIEKLFGWL
jgi:hypothetical protein